MSENTFKLCIWWDLYPEDVKNSCNSKTTKTNNPIQKNWQWTSIDISLKIHKMLIKHMKAQHYKSLGLYK